jgi:hypothetical protein
LGKQQLARAFHDVFFSLAAAIYSNPAKQAPERAVIACIFKIRANYLFIIMVISSNVKRLTKAHGFK